ncbi:Multidrug resistance-associated protein [Paratrimastix pyriformis]|uniref:Multidrug resistance-associated protein n=1 Tax=Paratrimastix pyriformis TaxID=342808 RepID=A0ABQ8V079_9EUKA|nr:Multidrug resistance-associated protein [Paratrimastix pyriformis]
MVNLVRKLEDESVSYGMLDQLKALWFFAGGAPAKWRWLDYLPFAKRLAKHRLLIVILTVMGLVTSLCSSIPAYINGKIVDSIISSLKQKTPTASASSPLSLLLFISAFAALSYQIVHGILVFQTKVLSEEIGNSVLLRTYSHLFTLDYAFFEQNAVGKVLERTKKGAQSMATFAKVCLRASCGTATPGPSRDLVASNWPGGVLSGGGGGECGGGRAALGVWQVFFNSLLLDTVSFGFSLAVLFRTSLFLGLLQLSVFVVYWVFIEWSSSRQCLLETAVLQRNEDLFGRVLDFFARIRLVRLLNVQAKLDRALARSHDQILHEKRRSLAQERYTVACSRLILEASTALATVYMAIAARRGAITVGDFVTAEAFFRKSLGFAKNMFSDYSLFVEQRAAMSRLQWLFTQHRPAPGALDPAQPALVTPGSWTTLSFEHVSFAYPASAEELVRPPDRLAPPHPAHPGIEAREDAGARSAGRLTLAVVGLVGLWAATWVQETGATRLRAPVTDVSFSIRRGEKVAVVGFSGAGKSTLAKLLLRLYECQGGGRICFDQTPLTRLTASNLFQLVHLVPQDNELLNASIRANLLLTRPDAGDLDAGDEQLMGVGGPPAGGASTEGKTDKKKDKKRLKKRPQAAPGRHDPEDPAPSPPIAPSPPGPLDGQLREALGQASALGFVDGLPHGLDTLIGPGGTSLSGGEVQRLCIARALVAAPDVLVLDEATSNLDAMCEAAIFEHLARLPATVTLIAITHRVASVARFDRVLVLDQGRVADFGPPEELRARCPVYQRLLQAAQTVGCGMAGDREDPCELAPSGGEPSPPPPPPVPSPPALGPPSTSSSWAL